jgi:hypothetical protein
MKQTDEPTTWNVSDLLWLILQRYRLPLTYNHETESVNMSQMDINRKTCDIRTWGKHLFPDISCTNIDRYTCPVTLLVRWNAQKSFDCSLSHFRIWSGIICDFRTSLREFLDQVVKASRDKYFPQ